MTRLWRKPTRTVALLCSVFALLAGFAAAGPAYADDYGKIYSLVSDPANCLAATYGPQIPDIPITTGCFNDDSEQWTYSSGTHRIISGIDGGGQWCLRTGPGGNGQPVGITVCQLNDPAEQWTIVQQSLVSAVDGRCLDDPSGRQGVQLQLWDCNIGGNANQNWDIVGYTG
jgi:hypothetical protein